MPSMTGEFKLISSENYDEYLVDIGVNPMLRNMLKNATPVIHIKTEQDEWTITTTTTFKTIEIKFKLGEAFEEITVDGRCCKSIVTKRGEDKLLQIQISKDGPTSIVLREFADTEMKMILESPGGVIACRTFQKQ